LLLGNVDPGSDKALAAGCRDADTTDVADRSIGADHPFREVEPPMVRQHPLNFMRDELPIIRVYQRHILRYGRRSAARNETVDREQFGRPVLEAGSGECPAPCVSQPLSLRKVELRLFAVVDIEIDPDPIQDRAILRPEWFSAAEEPAVGAVSVTNSKGHFPSGARLEAG